MGWTFFHKPVGVKAVEAIKREMPTAVAEGRIVASTATREAVFLVIRTDKPGNVYVRDADGSARALAVFKIAMRPRDEYNFGYKDMDETAGPYGCEAPMSILAKCSELLDPVGPEPRYSSLRNAREYRARCAKAAATKALKRGLKAGTKIKLAEKLNFGGTREDTFTVEKRGRRVLFRATAGWLARISARGLEGATVE